MLCLPLKEHKCANVRLKKDDTIQSNLSMVRNNLGLSSLSDAGVAGGSQLTVSPVASSYDDSVMDGSNVSATDTLNTDVCFDNLMYKLYGTNLINSADGDSVWCARWGLLVQHSGNHYILPGGSAGRRFVDVLTEEVSHLAVSNYPSERVLAFSSVVLQRDHMVRKGADVHLLLERRISLWREEKFDLLIKEAARCNQALQ